MRTIGKFKVQYSCRNTINTLKIVKILNYVFEKIFLKKYKCINSVKTKTFIFTFYVLC